MRWGMIVIGCLLFSSMITTTQAQFLPFEPSPYVYPLKISECKHEPESQRQTGFRVKSRVDIITALHGVADCMSIHALPDDGAIFTDLTIQAVDMDHDVALLSSPELEGLPTDGLPIAHPNNLQTRGLRVLGYPLA